MRLQEEPEVQLGQLQERPLERALEKAPEQELEQERALEQALGLR